MAVLTVYPESVDATLEPKCDCLLVDVLANVFKLPIQIRLLLREQMKVVFAGFLGPLQSSVRVAVDKRRSVQRTSHGDSWKQDCQFVGG